MNSSYIDKEYEHYSQTLNKYSFDDFYNKNTGENAYIEFEINKQNFNSILVLYFTTLREKYSDDEIRDITDFIQIYVPKIGVNTIIPTLFESKALSTDHIGSYDYIFDITQEPYSIHNNRIGDR